MPKSPIKGQHVLVNLDRVALAVLALLKGPTRPLMLIPMVTEAIMDRYLPF